MIVDHWQLPAHASAPSQAIRTIEISIARLSAQKLLIVYDIHGDIDALVIPAKVKPSRTSGLWESTCCEAFARYPGTPGYTEFNMSPSNRWAAYRFSGYREGMRAIATGLPPEIDFAFDEHHASMRVELDLATLGPGYETLALHLGVAVVIEERRGPKSYWALQHPSDKPDFHHADCFAVQLAPSR